MATKKEQTRNMTNKSKTASQRKAEKVAREYGRGKNSVFTVNRSANPNMDNASNMAKAWNLAEGKARSRNAKGQYENKAVSQAKGNVQTYTRSVTGRMSVDGRTAGGSTWAFTPKNDDGSPVVDSKGRRKQSGLSKISDRDTRYREVKRSLNNVEPAVQKMGGYEGLRARGLTDEEIRNIYGINPDGSRTNGRGLSVG